jgi:glycerophosphoryl diester phosphodiesterase
MATGSFPYKHRPLNFGHRGANTAAPENTLAAFGKARESGADGIELDVMLCADGEPVVIHDFTVDRTTNGHGRVEALSLAQLKALDAGAWFGSEFAGERIPTLREVIEWAADDMLLNIELKNFELRSDGLEAKVAALIREHQLQSRAMLSSFNPLSLRRVKGLAPELHTGLLYAPGLPIYLRRAWLRPLARVDALHPPYEMVNQRYLDWARRRRYRVNVWNPNDRDDLQRLIAQRVDMIITDQPCVLAMLLQTREGTNTVEGLA